MRLAFLAPDVVKALLDDSIDLTAERKARLDELRAASDPVSRIKVFMASL